MAIPAHLYKFVMGGRLCNTESWSCSLHYGNAATQAPLNANVATALGNFAGLMYNAAWIDWWKWNEVSATTGKYLSPTNSRTEFLTPPINGNATLLPPQDATVLTLTTAAARGRAHQGRIYLPMAQTPEADGRISVTAANFLLSASQTAMNALGNALLSELIVWSQVGQTSQPVTGYSIGRVVDTQRRRRRNLLEAPVHVSLAGTVS